VARRIHRSPALSLLLDLPFLFPAPASGRALFL